MRIIHLSDLHLNPIYNKAYIEKTEAALFHALNNGFDHLVVTGDITHNADEESFLLFRNMLKKYDLLDANKTSVIVGNHDIFGGVYTAKDLLHFPEKCKKTDYQSKLLQFIGHFEELFLDCYFPSNEFLFPFSKDLGNTVLVGLNTNDIYSGIKNPFASNGRVSDREFEDLYTILSRAENKGKNIIVLSHHHFYKNSFEAKSSSSELWNKIEGFTLKLRGKKKLIKLFRKYNVNIVLHGHSHENKLYERMGVKFLNSGGTIDNESDNSIKINILDFTSNEVTIKEKDYILMNEGELITSNI